MDGGRNIIRSRGWDGDSLKKKQTTGAGFRAPFRGLLSSKRRERRGARNGGWTWDRSTGCTQFRYGYGRYSAGRRRTRNWWSRSASSNNGKASNKSHKERNQKTRSTPYHYSWKAS